MVEVDVAVGEVGRLLRLPRRHPQLIHPTTGLLRLTWTPSRTLVHEPPVADSSPHQTQDADSSPHVSPVPESLS